MVNRPESLHTAQVMDAVHTRDSTDPPRRGHARGASRRGLHERRDVKAYVSRLLTKLEVENRVQIALLVREAQR